MAIYPSGTRIADRYEVAGAPLLGGMGIVYLCFDHQEQRPVALKTFRPAFLSDRGARDRFLQEGETWVRLGKHPHIVRCYSVFQDSPRPEVYLALELIAKEEGRRDASLRSWLTPGRPVPVEQALLIALQIVRGMRHATDTIPGFVHRDLKPENVLVGADRLSNAAINRVRVTDFGLAKGLRTEQLPTTAADLAAKPDRLTQMGSVVGTPLYMAPEQWDMTDVSIQADIYALGCIIGEMVTGRLLALDMTLTEYLQWARRMQQDEQQRALRRAHQGGQALDAARAAPPALADLLGRCLATEPAQRYASWSAVEAALTAAYHTVTGQPPLGPEAANAPSRSERVAAGWSYSAMGGSYYEMGNAQAALACFQRAYETGQAEKEPPLAAAGLSNLGNAYAQLGDARQAIGYHEQALAIYWELGDRSGEGIALGNLGIAYRQLGDARQAIGYYQRALAIQRELGNRQGEGSNLSNLGNAYLRLGVPQSAIGYLEQALVIRQEIGDRHGESADLCGQGIAYRHIGNARRAIGYYEQALAIQRETGDLHNEGGTLGNLGLACADLGDARRAIGYYEQALAIRREIGDRAGEGNDLGNIGIAYLSLGAAQQAIDYLEQAVAIRREVGDRYGEGNDVGNLGSVYLHLENPSQAIGYYEQALAIRREIGDRRGEGRELGNLGNAYLELGDGRRAIGYSEQALAILREIGDLNGAASAFFNLALSYRQLGERQRALPLAREAARLWSQMGHIAYAQRAQQLAAQLGRQGQ